MIDRKFTLILCGSGWGAPDQRAAFGPHDFYDEDFRNLLDTYDFEIFSTFYHHVDAIKTQNCFADEGFKALAYHNLSAMFQHHAYICEQAVRRGRFPIILGGDHSIAVGTWSGIRAADQSKHFGLIWLDAHMDAHTPTTTPSNAPHGMPVAVLMGYGSQNWVELCHFSPKIDADRIAMIGIRDFEDGEALLLKELAVKVFDMPTVHNNGFTKCFNESLEIAKGDNGFYGISLDLDALDLKYVPGTGTPVQDGLVLDNVLQAFKGMAYDPNCTGIEITEINLKKDPTNTTRCTIQQIIKSILSNETN